MRNLVLFTLAAAVSLPLFAADYRKARDISALFAQESALTYIVYSPEGEKKEFSLGLGGQGAEKSVEAKGIRGTVSLDKEELRLNINGRAFRLKPRIFAEGKLILWVQVQPLVRIVVPASFKGLEPALAATLNAELDALDPFGGGYDEEGYAEEGE